MKQIIPLLAISALAAWSATAPKLDCNLVEGFPAVCLSYTPAASILKPDSLTLQCLSLIQNPNPEVRSCARDAFGMIVSRAGDQMSEAVEGEVEGVLADYPCELLDIFTKSDQEFRQASARFVATIYHRDLDDRVDAASRRLKEVLQSCPQPKAKLFQEAFLKQLKLLILKAAD